MNLSEIALDDLERDALTEVVNIGVSRAAASLRKMVGRQVLLSVPAVEIVTQKAAAALIGSKIDEDALKRMAAAVSAACRPIEARRARGPAMPPADRRPAVASGS